MTVAMTLAMTFFKLTLFDVVVNTECYYRADVDLL